MRGAGRLAVPSTAALVLVVTAAHADDADARAYFRPRDPVAFVALGAGFGGFEAGSTTGPDGQQVGTVISPTLSARLDVEALAPLWVSVSGRAFVGQPAQAELDPSVGYELRWYTSSRSGTSGETDYSRMQLRPFVGLRELRFANDPYAATTERVTAARVGADFVLNDSVGLRGFDMARARVQVLWDATARGPGVEVEDFLGISTKNQSTTSVFGGLTLGFMPSTGLLFELAIGAQWEVGR